jgi:hypothetical protein
MLWNHKKRKKTEQEELGSGLTVGQRFDLVDTATEIASRGFNGGSKNPLNWMTGSMAMADIAISAGTAKRGDFVAAGGSAFAAQGSAMLAFPVGVTMGEMIGNFILPVAGGVVGGIIGGGIASLVTDKAVRVASTRLFHGFALSRPRVRFGGNFKDSQPAYNMRQKAEQELSSSLLNARRYLGREAQLMHQ